MSDESPRVKSPASRGMRVIVAGIFVAIWLTVIVYDFFANAGATIVPFWFQAAGLIVLGYLLGIAPDDLSGGLPGGK
jgi:hypothetical protein